MMYHMGKNIFLFPRKNNCTNKFCWFWNKRKRKHLVVFEIFKLQKKISLNIENFLGIMRGKNIQRLT